ncbi:MULTISPECIES: hypothetical protein [Pseudomonas]|uniref:hypothetical protein n=1 Tax=Pseudomonas TaxID=286 RepID=UPI0015E2B486|nr:hypothetical protein [Pseudomonas viridiflava]MBA1230149.1 hypothetical protein [Pseudomonas viridiflava]MEE4149558.1 hypothetical protein [Pseudomonas viridiflava]
MDVAAFVLLGLLTGAAAGWLFFAFGDKKTKGVAAVGGVVLPAIEIYLGLKEFLTPGQNPGLLIFSNICAYVVSLVGIICLFVHLLSRQDTKFKITVIDIIFSNSKSLDEYHSSRKLEIEALLKKDLGVDELEKRKSELDLQEKQLIAREVIFQKEVEDAKVLIEEQDKLVGNNFSITIPQKYKHSIRQEFFDLLPRYAKKLGGFYAQLRYLRDEFEKPNLVGATLDDVFDSYLYGVATYMCKSLFDQAANQDNEVRIHFRKYDPLDGMYKSHIVVPEVESAVTPIRADDGLIKVSRESKRSLVYSANKKDACDTESQHLWQDYLTFVFEQIKENDQPKYSIGISVKHKVVYTNLLYFLSFIQFEQVIQQDMVRLYKSLKKHYGAKVA